MPRKSRRSVTRRRGLGVRAARTAAPPVSPGFRLVALRRALIVLPKQDVLRAAQDDGLRGTPPDTLSLWPYWKRCARRIWTPWWRFSERAP
jgi:hypothetical protein